ncbi:MAG: hypothetical protein QNJ91_11730 [Gammaproteobacteria bacterium]|nr:hypothetical protein [Gammaproteobacteria bacterium]
MQQHKALQPPHRRPTPEPWCTLALCVWLVTTPVDAVQRIGDRPEAVSLLAESLIDADAADRWAFADAMLEVMIEGYDDEIRSAARDRPSTRKGQLKLQRWRAATHDLVDRLTAARLHLTEGADAVIHVDPQRQVLLFVGTQAIALSAPRPGAETEIGSRVVARYCAFNDCSILDGLAEAATRPEPGGTWAMRDGYPPAYALDDRLSCQFADLRQRFAKQQACRDLARESQMLLDTIRNAQRSGHRIAWSRLRAERRVRGSEIVLPVTQAGDYLRLPAATLGRLHDADWAGLLDWVRSAVTSEDTPLQIRYADTLLADVDD